jgi:hypothetical protein
MFHRPVAHIVDETQKTEILTVLRAPAPLSGRMVALVTLLVGMTVGIVTGFHGAPLWASVAFALESWFVASMIGVGLAMHLKLRELAPILAALPRSNEQLFPELNRFRRPSGQPRS